MELQIEKSKNITLSKQQQINENFCTSESFEKHSKWTPSLDPCIESRAINPISFIDLLREQTTQNHLTEVKFFFVFSKFTI